MRLQRGLSYRLVLVLILPAAYCQITPWPVSFITPRSGSVLTKGDSFNVTWLMNEEYGYAVLDLNICRTVDSDVTTCEFPNPNGINYTTDRYFSSQTWTPSLSLASGDGYFLMLTDIDMPAVYITSDRFTLRDPSFSSLETTTVTISPPTNSVALSTFPTSSPTMTAPTLPESSSTQSSSDSSPAAAIGGSVGGVFAAIVIAFILISRRKGWFFGKAQVPELGERDGGEEMRVRHLSELEGNVGKYLGSVDAELQGSVPVFELPEGGHDEGAELPGSVPALELPEGGHDESAEGMGTVKHR
ncbi:uncharacterized protein LAJ45_03745 [Morchella importuna]|uniref:uncharacterized protein n=1 Tax=Morchella importuna TaxID=1174673 RepID=UPI001E8ED0B6|nr:uncharacterized protein LAJ45_03745 [Morchella importuna]KAH8152318.1 hypothetical protein LAJ45_03745 [Morchella importuna]